MGEEQGEEQERDAGASPGSACLTLLGALVALGIAVGLVASLFAGGPETPGDDPGDATPLKRSGKVVRSWAFTTWPFTVPAGVLRCREDTLVTFEANGVEYGLSGSAQTRGYPFPDDLRAADPVLGPEVKISTDEVMKAGAELC